ncbi:hypothetical protein GCM10023159_27350 [Brevibacterium yomogidense]
MRRVDVVDLDSQGATVRAHGERAVETAVRVPHLVEVRERTTGGVAEFGMVPLALEFRHDHEGDDDLVFGEPQHGPRVGQEDGGVEDVGDGCAHG